MSGTKLSNYQINKDSVKGSNIVDQTIETSDLQDGCVTETKIADRSIGYHHLDSSVIERLLPENSETRRVFDALASSNNPNAQNPFLTKSDMKGGHSNWGSPFEESSSFHGDSNFTVRFNTSDGLLYYKDERGRVRNVKFSHSHVVDVDSMPNHQHVTQAQKSILDRLVALGFDPSDPESPVAVVDQIGNDGVWVFSKMFSSVADESAVVVEHSDYIDDHGRSVDVYVPVTSPVIYDANSSYGHGFYPKRRREHMYNFGTRAEIDRPDHYVDSDSIEFDSSTSLTPNGYYWINRGIVGLRLVKSQRRVSSVGRIEGGQSRVSFSGIKKDSNLPFVLANIEVGSGGGYAGILEQSQFETIADMDMDNTSNVRIVSDCQGSYYIFHIDNGGMLKCQRVHSSGKFISDVDIRASAISAPWKDQRVSKIAASIWIKAGAPLTRRLVVFMVTESNEMYALLSEEIPDSTTRDIRTDTSINLNFSHKYIPSDGTWSMLNGFIPQQVEIVVPSQGTSESTPVALVTDSNVVMWVSFSDPISDMSSSSSGVFANGSSFKAVAGSETVEMIVRSADGHGSWHKHQMIMQNNGQLAPISDSVRGAKVTSFEDYGFDKADICYISTSPTTGIVLFGTLGPDGSTKLKLHAHAMVVGSTGSPASTSISQEASFERDVHVGKSLNLCGGIHGHVFVSDIFDGIQTFYYKLSLNDSLSVDYMSPEHIIPGDVVGSWSSLVRYIKNHNSGTISVVRGLRQANGQGNLINENDLSVISKVGGAIHLSTKRPAVRMRTSYGDFRDSEVSCLLDQSELASVEGSAMSSIAHVDSGNEWIFVSGGLPDLSVDSGASSQFALIRRRSGSYTYATNIADAVMERRAYHGQYVISNRQTYVPTGVPANSALVYMFGGKKRSSIDSFNQGNLVAPELSRFTFASMDATGAISPSPTLLKSSNLSSRIPSMVKPAMFLCKKSTGWMMVIVSPPTIYALSDSDDRTLFGSNLPNETDVVSYNADALVKLSQRGSMSYFQRIYGSGDDSNICWNPDIQLSQPGLTTVLLYGGEGATSVEDNLRVIDIDPDNISLSSWRAVTVTGYELPDNRADSTLVYSGVYQGTGTTHHLFYMFGGTSGSTVKDDMWLLDYWVDGSKPMARWTYLTSGKNFGLMGPASNAAAVRRPNSMSKSTSASTHSVYFYGGRNEHEVLISDMHLLQLPEQMKGSPDINIPAMAFDHGGDNVPVGSFAISDAIDISNVDSLVGPLEIEFFNNCQYDYENEVRVGLAIDSTDNVYTISGGTWSSPISWGDYHEMATFDDFQNSLSSTLTPLIRGSSGTPWFTETSKRLYIVLYVNTVEPMTNFKIHKVSILSKLIETPGAIDHVTWQKVSAGINIAMVSPNAVVVENDTGGSIDHMKVVITGREDI